MSDTLNEIKELQQKMAKAQTLLTRYKTQLEGIVEEKSELAEKLSTDYGTTVEGAHEKLAEYTARQTSLLSEAKEALDKITL